MVPKPSSAPTLALPAAAGDVLIVVDVQNGFVNANSEHVVPVILELAKNWRNAGGKVVATQFFNEPGSQWESLIDWSEVMSSPQADLVDGLADVVDAAVPKHLYTSLVPDVQKHLPEPPAPVAVCGIDTDVCVLKTAVDLFESGYRPIVLTEACASHGGDTAHTSGLTVLRRLIGERQLV